MWRRGAAAVATDLLDLVPGFLPLLQLPLGLVQLPEEASQVPAAAAARGQAAEHGGRAGREAATHKVPYAAVGSVQAWMGRQFYCGLEGIIITFLSWTPLKCLPLHLWHC